MALPYRYRARTAAGALVTGVMRANGTSDATAALRERDLFPVQVTPLAATPPFRLFHRTPMRERLAFFRAYAALEGAGIDFSTAFQLLAAQAQTARFREAIDAVRYAVERNGEPLWSAMESRPDDFTELEVALVAAGEYGGARKDVLERLAGVLERNDRLRKRLHAVLVYPAIVIAAAAALSLYIFAAVVPQFAALFVSFGVKPSLPVLALVAVSRAMTLGSAMAALALAVVALITARRVLSTPSGRTAAARLLENTPLAGRLLYTSALARVTNVLSALLESGVQQVRALAAVRAVAGGSTLAAALEEAGEALASGAAPSLGEALERTNRFPGLVTGFVRVGERAGNLPQMLRKLADYYGHEVEAGVEAIPALVQTAVTVGLGALVGVLVYAVYVPLTTLTSSIR